MTIKAIVADILDPVTLRTARHTRLLSTLMDWSGEPKILKVAIEAGLVTPDILLRMAQFAKYTADNRGETGLSERQVAGHLLVFFLRDRQVRRAIARYVHQAHGVKLRQAMRDLWSMRDELELYCSGRRDA